MALRLPQGSLPEDVAVSYFMEANFMQDIILR